MKENNAVTRSGIGFCGLLAIVFITLKLVKVIAWPWVWVLAPIWIPAALTIVCFAILGIVIIAAASK
jgi:hypothetical protein